MPLIIITLILSHAMRCIVGLVILIVVPVRVLLYSLAVTMNLQHSFYVESLFTSCVFTHRRSLLFRLDLLFGMRFKSSTRIFTNKQLDHFHSVPRSSSSTSKREASRLFTQCSPQHSPDYNAFGKSRTFKFTFPLNLTLFSALNVESHFEHQNDRYLNRSQVGAMGLFSFTCAH